MSRCVDQNDRGAVQIFDELFFFFPQSCFENHYWIVVSGTYDRSQFCVFFRENVIGSVVVFFDSNQSEEVTDGSFLFDHVRPGAKSPIHKSFFKAACGSAAPSLFSLSIKYFLVTNTFLAVNGPSDSCYHAFGNPPWV